MKRRDATYALGFSTARDPIARDDVAVVAGRANLAQQAGVIRAPEQLVIQYEQLRVRARVASAASSFVDVWAAA